MRVRFLRVIVATAAAELVADALWQRGALAIEEREMGERNLLVTSFEDPDATDAAVRDLARMAGVLAVEPVEEDDSYLDTWRAHAEPVRAGERLLIVPPWVTSLVPDGALVVRVDPGRVFGSGSHPTTRLMLAALERRLGPRVLDVGCGSGVLALAAARLGAVTVHAIDTDPRARVVTQANARASGCNITVVGSTVSDAVGPYDVILANIGAAALVELAPHLQDLARIGAAVVLSGMLADRWGPVVDAYDRCRTLRVDELDGWVAVELERTG